MDVRFLTTFLEVAETRHFGRAADNLFLTQSAVSARIKLLEEYFNTVLFIRHRNSIQITPAGEKLLPFARRLADTLTDARKLLAEEECQHVSCASTQNAFALFMSSMLPTLLSSFSQMSFRHEVSSSEQLTRHLHEHRIDFALSTNKLKADDIVDIPLLEFPLSVFESSSTDAADSQELQDINVEWASHINDDIYERLPELRKARFRTSSIDVATSIASQRACRLILPSANHEHIDQRLRNTMQSFKQSPDKLNIKAVVYLHKLKKVNNTGIEELIQFMQNDEFSS
ncbi:LysR family transcriptional regulator [Glaciecola sp. MH2013]|uniref:LysR family transcriptional regulator n=1 Tax=Glaciecola sp. MH2013 TaxID=2785524 RepID=UPI00189D4A4E|nr:LysR family transcriptional regulator [Glaciecola sp. MH2013]MBF7075038.1 LysR family transcriptional regulator [Glaciecola sp. MH2013]